MIRGQIYLPQQLNQGMLNQSREREKGRNDWMNVQDVWMMLSYQSTFCFPVWHNLRVSDSIGMYRETSERVKGGHVKFARVELRTKSGSLFLLFLPPFSPFLPSSVHPFFSCVSFPSAGHSPNRILWIIVWIKPISWFRLRQVNLYNYSKLFLLVC